MAAKVVKILTLAAINALTLDERKSLYKENVIAPFRSIKTAQKKATESLHVAAKVHASLKREHVALLAMGLPRGLASGTSEKEFFEKHCGGTPSGRVLAVSSFFNAMCNTMFTVTVVDDKGNPVMDVAKQAVKDGVPQVDDKGKPVMAAPLALTVQKSLLEETTQFDPHSGNSLEIAATCIAAERKASADGWMTTDNTLDVISAMSTPGDATTKLKEIRKKQKGDKEENTSSENPPHTIDSCVSFLKAAIVSGADILKGENGEQIVSELYAVTFFEMGNLWSEAGIEQDLIDKWTANIEAKVAPWMERKTEAPVPNDEQEEAKAEELEPAAS